MAETGGDETLDVFCPVCNVQVEALVLTRHVVTKPVYDGPRADPVDDPYYVTVFTFAACRRCEQPFLTEQSFAEVPGDFSAPVDELAQVYPQGRRIPLDSVPTTAVRPYRAALQSFRVQLYEPCVIMCRKCVEAVCAERGATKGSLSQRLKLLQSEGAIDQTLLMWADGVRMVANDAAHDLEAEISKADARDALEFAEAILLYVFALQNRFAAFQTRRAGGGSVAPTGGSS